jgi:hypothetical protein
MCQHSHHAVNALLEAYVDIIRSGEQYPAPILEIRTLPQPPTPDHKATGKLLLSIPLDPSTIYPEGLTIPQVVSTVSGKMNWARLYNRDGKTIVDYSITEFDRGGDIEVTSLELVDGQTVHLPVIGLTI